MLFYLAHFLEMKINTSAFTWSIFIRYKFHWANLERIDLREAKLDRNAFFSMPNSLTRIFQKLDEKDLFSVPLIFHAPI